MISAVEPGTEAPPGTELRNHSTQSVVAIQGWPSILFGLPFLAAGILIALVPTGLLGDQSEAMHVAPWVVSVCGALFALAGVFVIGNGAAGLRLQLRTARFRAKFPNEPWAWDHRWRIEGMRATSGRSIASAIMFAAFWWLLLVPFNYLMASGKVPLPVTLVLILFDAIGVFIVGNVIYQVLRRLKYGPGELRFARFPFTLGDTLDVTLPRRGALAALTELTATLRCVQERYEIRRSGDDRQHVVACYEVHAQTQTMHASPGADFRMEFALPAEGLATRLSDRPARYWELELRADTPGIDYAATFLVPVYERARHQA